MRIAPILRSLFGGKSNKRGDVLQQANDILEKQGIKRATRKEVINDRKGLSVGVYEGFGFAHHFRDQTQMCISKRCKYLVAVPRFDGSLWEYNCNHPQVTWVVEIGGVQECPKKSSKVPRWI